MSLGLPHKNGFTNSITDAFTVNKWQSCNAFTTFIAFCFTLET